MSQQQGSSISGEATRAQDMPSPYRFVIGGLLILLNFSTSISFFAVAPVTPLIMEEYGVNRSAASLLVSVVILVQTVLAIPASILVGRTNLKKIIAIAWLIAAVPSLTFLASSFPLLLTLRVVYGLCFAMILPSVGPLTMQWFRPKELPLINSLGIAAVSAGIAVSAFAGAPLAEALGWRGALSLLGTVALVGAGVWLLLGRVRRPAVQPGQRLSL